ncbi:hypothetical protein IJ670_06630, partial [bacterium]|nr:hypothetical protein [bacterium]
MKDLFKNSKFILILIVLFAFLLRYLKFHLIDGVISTPNCALCEDIFKFHLDFFACLKSNCLAPLNSWAIKGWYMLFKSYKFYPITISTLSCLVMYFVGKSYLVKNNSEFIALSCSFMTAVSAYLIYNSLNSDIYSLVFLMSALVVLFSVKYYQTRYHIYLFWLIVSSI